MYYATAKEMERLDALAVENGLEIRQMMELAGWHMVGVFRKLGVPQKAKVTVVCGKGNKGGDGLSAARHLVDHKWKVEIILLDREISPDSEHHLRLLEKMQASIILYPEQKEEAEQRIMASDVLIDALIGYHLEGAPKGIFKEAVEAMNKSKKKIIAYDLPSGVDASTGKCLFPCILAFATLSLAMPKKAFQVAEGKKVSGEVFIADIGIPDFLYNMIVPKSRPAFEDFPDSLVVL